MTLAELAARAEKLTKLFAIDCTNACQYEDPRDACHLCRAAALLRDLLAYASTVSQERDKAEQRTREAEHNAWRDAADLLEKQGLACDGWCAGPIVEFFRRRAKATHPQETPT